MNNEADRQDDVYDREDRLVSPSGTTATAMAPHPEIVEPDRPPEPGDFYRSRRKDGAKKAGHSKSVEPSAYRTSRAHSKQPELAASGISRDTGYRGTGVGRAAKFDSKICHPAGASRTSTDIARRSVADSTTSNAGPSMVSTDAARRSTAGSTTLQPGAVRVRPSLLENDPGPSLVTIDPTNPLTDHETNAQPPNLAAGGDTPIVAARVVSSYSLAQVDDERQGDEPEVLPVLATAEKDSAWRHFKRNKKLQLALVAVLLIVVILAVTLGVVMSKGSGQPTESASPMDDFWESLQEPDVHGEEMEGKFGAFVSMNRDGTRMAVGSPNVFGDDIADDGSIQRGMVSIYDRTENGWTKVQDIPLSARDDASTLFEAMKEVRSELVVDLSRDGNTLSVGAPFHDALNYTNTGQVEVFSLDGEGNWTARGAPLTGKRNGEYFGASVSLSEEGGMLAIGMPGKGKDGKQSGAASVYLFNDGNWERLGAQDIVGGSEGQMLGGSVSLSSDGFTIAVGSSATSASTNTKVANAYEFKGGNWQEMGTGMSGGVGLYDTAYDVALSADGQRVVISNHYTFSQASNSDVYEENIDLFVQAFQFQSGDWAHLGENMHAKEPGEKSGYFVSLNDEGNIILMGDPGREVESGGNTGHAHLYVYDTDSVGFKQLGPNINGEDAGDLFGASVSISGDGQYIASGSPTYRGMGYEYGRVKVCNVPEGLLVA